MLFDFTGKTVLVTGAARGIGRAAAAAFAEHGGNVVASDLEETPHTERCDVTRQDEINRTVASVIERFGSIDVLFNNAGINRRIPLADWTEEDWNAVIRVNFIGSFLMARAVGLHMR